MKAICKDKVASLTIGKEYQITPLVQEYTESLLSSQYIDKNNVSAIMALVYDDKLEWKLYPIPLFEAL